MTKFYCYGIKELEICRQVFNRYFRNYKFNKADFIFAGYIFILEHKNELKDLTDNAYYEKCYDFADRGMKKYSNDLHYKDLQTITIDTTLNNEDNPNFGFDIFADSHLVDDNINYKCLVHYINKFCSNYDKDKLKIFSMFFNGYNLDKIKNLTGVNYANIKSIIITFREDLYNYLLENELLEKQKFDFDNIPLSINTIQSNRYDMFKKAKANGTFDYSMCKNDYFIYKLIRTDKDIAKYSNLLNIELKKLENIIYHKVNCLKLKLYEIQKLRNICFSNYTLADLVNCEAVC